MQRLCCAIILLCAHPQITSHERPDQSAGEPRQPPERFRPLAYLKATQGGEAMAKHGMIEPLEHRRLLSLATLGPEVQVPVPHEVRSFDLAVAADGSYIIATSGIANGGDTEVSAVRY